MQVFIKTLTGATITVNTTEDATVLSLKQTVSEEQQIPIEEMILICGLSQLDDEKTLSEAGVEDESTVTMTLRLAGGKKKRKKGHAFACKCASSNNGLFSVCPRNYKLRY